ncbi:MAG: hypothetical protein V1919_03910 [Candidatus Omnitrophota bacterium]
MIDKENKKKKPSEYLEIHLEENGAVIFSNLSQNKISLLETISRKKQESLNFYCG